MALLGFGAAKELCAKLADFGCSKRTSHKAGVQSGRATLTFR